MQKLVILFCLLITITSCRSKMTGEPNHPRDYQERSNQNQPIGKNNQEVEEAAPEQAADDRTEEGQQTTPLYTFKRATADADVIATIEKTPCYGTCPVYKLMILKSGKAYYEGQYNVENIGKFTTTFSSSEIDALQKKADEIGYWKMADKYDSPVTDFPTTITSIRKGNKSKAIHNRVDGPPELVSLEKLMETILKQKELIKISKD